MGTMKDDDLTGGGSASGRKKSRRATSSALGRGSRADQATAQIGSRLRKMYDDVVDEPIPDEFKALLDQLDEGETDK